MNRRPLSLLIVAATALVLAMVTPSPAVGSTAAGSYVLTATNPDSSAYAPTFVGNGYLGVRVPAAGQGYAAGTVPAQSEVAGFYAQPPGDVQQRANIPTWSTLRFGDGSSTFSMASGTITHWRQQLDLHDGVITTTARWQAPDGHVTDLRYDVFTDRARKYVAAVRLEATPRWSGSAVVTDLIDGTPADLTSGVEKGFNTSSRQIWESVRTEGTGLVAGLASTVGLSASAGHPQARPMVGIGDQSIGQRFTFPVRAGQSYTATKYVGVATSTETGDPLTLARRQSSDASGTGFAALHIEDRAAWLKLWAGRVDVLGNPQLATEVNASEFYLWSNTRPDSDWSISPAGLSSNGYDGHIFWDAETWMHPALLAQHPDLAAGMDAYRYERLAAARAHAAETGNQGARFPWESALDGTEQIPPPVSINSEGLYEQHITADIALAQWQYYLATGDRTWLADRGWPVLEGAATFWAGRAVKGADGNYHIRHVTGPDEENPNVDDEAYTNVAAATTLRIASAAARLLGESAPTSWQTIADGLVVPVKSGIHPEFDGYQGQMVKQADVTMLQYPWSQPMSPDVAQHDLNYYVPRSDPDGPSMSDAINSIDTSALGSPGCASYTYTLRSIEPFMRDVFDQFSETRDGGAFTFMTGIGGFLQEFLYGYSGLRIGAHSVTLDPSLTSQLTGVVLHGLAWHGRRFTVSVGQTNTTVTLDSGSSLPIRTAGVTHSVTQATALTVPTRRPDRTPTTDLVRCQDATASDSAPGAPPLAAVDGSPATDWQPSDLPARLTVPLREPDRISTARLTWGHEWPPPPAPNVHPPPGPVITLRPTAYDLLVSADGTSWHTVAHVTVTGKRDKDTLNFPAQRAKYVAVRVISAADHRMPMLQELVVQH
jgi:trehalose/maltose hydrolase-like predicted phosphorylase